MSKATYTLEIQQSVAQVFRYLDDSDYAKQWIGGLEAIEPLTEGGNRVGAQAKHTYLENGRTITMLEETLIYEPNQRVKIKGVSAGFELLVDYRLQSIPTGTRLEYEVEIRMTSWWMWLLQPIIYADSQRRLAADFARLKALAEAPR